MNPAICTIRDASELPDFVLEVIQRLSLGELVGIPTPYGEVAIRRGVQSADQLHGFNQDQLLRIEESSATGGWVWAFRNLDEAKDFYPRLPTIAERLLTRTTPGSLIIIVSADCDRFTDQYLAELPNPGLELADSQLLRDQLIPLQVAGKCEHSAFCLLSGTFAQMLQSMIPWPLQAAWPALPAENSADVPAEAATPLEKIFPNCLNYLLKQSSPSEMKRPAVIQISGQRVKVIQAGQLTDASIRERCGIKILFVCTGNTCRSPMAEAICRKMIANRLSCDIEELRSRGVEIGSAGIAADFGAPASPESVELVAELGLDLGEHLSQPISPEMLEISDHIFTMTAYHRHLILSRWPELADRIEVLGISGHDIPDPIGGGMEVYRQCREAIEQGIENAIDRILKQP